MEARAEALASEAVILPRPYVSQSVHDNYHRCRHSRCEVAMRENAETQRKTCLVTSMSSRLIVSSHIPLR